MFFFLSQSFEMESLASFLVTMHILTVFFNDSARFNFNIFLEETFQNRENSKWSKIEIKAFVKSWLLCSALEYFRFVSILTLNFQDATNVPESVVSSWEESSSGGVAMFPLCCFQGSAMMQTHRSSLFPSLAACFSTHSQNFLFGYPCLGFCLSQNNAASNLSLCCPATSY